jgi:hypothetical protein
MIMHARPYIVARVRRRGRGLGVVDCTTPGASYWDQKGNVGSNLCSPLDTACVNAVGGAITQFQEEWDSCLAAAAGPTQAQQYLTLAQNTGDPYINAIQQQITAVQTTPPGKPLTPSPPITTPGGYIWPVGVAPPVGVSVLTPGGAFPFSGGSQQLGLTAAQTGAAQIGAGQPYYTPVAPPPAPVVVSPSPGSQPTTTGTSKTTPTSVVSQANGTTKTGADGGLISTVKGYLTDPAKDWISGVPNWAVVAAGGVGLAFIVMAMSRRR